MKLGLKLWSTNDKYRECAAGLHSQGIFDYIELMVVPGSLAEAPKWAKCGMPFVLHAPHSKLGMNLAVAGEMDKKTAIFKEIEEYRLQLSATHVIFHPGLDGTAGEFIRQFMSLSEDHPEVKNIAIVENKPAVGLDNERCVGAAPEEIASIIAQTGTGFCLDIGHAIFFANFTKRDWKQVLDEFMELKPAMFHLSDGRMGNDKDMHLNYGKGDFDFEYIINRLPADARISIETEKSSPDNLDDFVKDIEFLKKNRTRFF